MATKQEPGKYDCYNKAAEDEPIFTLRAKDPDAPQLVRSWVITRQAKWLAQNPSEIDLAQMPPAYKQKLAEALKCADDMEAWRKENIV